MGNRFTLIFSWLWPIIYPTILQIFAFGKDGMEVILKAVSDASLKTELTGAQKFSWVIEQVEPILLEMGKQFTKSALDRAIKIALDKLRDDFVKLSDGGNA